MKGKHHGEGQDSISHPVTNGQQGEIYCPVLLHDIPFHMKHSSF